MSDARQARDAKSSVDAVPRNRYTIFASIAFCGVALDLATKYLVFRWQGLPKPGANGPWWVLENYFGIQTAVNQGALFGMGKGYGAIFIILSLVAIIGILIWLFYMRAARDLLLTVALAGIMAGVLGNLYDRLGLWHLGVEVAEHVEYGVRDWILCQFQSPKYRWPNFNIADCLLVVGAILLGWHALRHHDETEEADSAGSSAND